ncbi:MAG: hypothetical protein IJ753_09305 [Bacteroidales bacterium]|nr:hypothetical protein [Bacteroidales bacterium]MBR1783694.1 hypothetical protein [Bacteroidales bacterium]
MKRYIPVCVILFLLAFCSCSKEKVTLYNGTPELLGHHFYMEFRFLSFFSGMDVPDFCSFGEMDCYWGHLGEGQQHSTDCSLQNYSW